MPIGSASSQDPAFCSADLLSATSSALEAAELAAAATVKGIKAAMSSRSQSTQEAFEASLYSAQAAYDAIKTARYAQKGAVAAQRPWKAAYDAFIQKAWRYWHPEDTERSKVTPAKRQREASSPASISSDDAASTYDEYDDMPYVAWTHSGNIKVQGGWDTIFEPLARELEDKSGHIQFFEASGDDFDPDVTELRFAPPSQDVLLRLARPVWGEDRWMVASTRFPFAAWA